MIILFISSRNIKLLKGYQKSYLIISIILFIIIFFIYLAKIIILIYTQFIKKIPFSSSKTKEKIKLVWIIVYGCCYLIMLIGLIYDIVLLIKGEISNVVYVIIYFIICFVYLILSVVEFFLIEEMIKIIIHPPAIPPMNDEKPKKKEKEDNDIDNDNEANKTKTE